MLDINVFDEEKALVGGLDSRIYDRNVGAAQNSAQFWRRVKEYFLTQFPDSRHTTDSLFTNDWNMIWDFNVQIQRDLLEGGLKLFILFYLILLDYPYYLF